jgi:peptidoglycan/xylan/chitin deacetylase (PgdA/CDA1 family)
MKLMENDESKGKLIITWDYELEKGAEARFVERKDWGIDDYHQTKKILTIFEKYSIKSTFYCLGYAGLGNNLPYSSSNQIMEISDKGHEIGSHTFNHEFIPELSYNGLVKTLSDSKKILEEIIGKSVNSFAPPYHYPNQFLKAGALGSAIIPKNWYSFYHNFQKIEISHLLHALKQTKYQNCRLSYMTIPHAVVNKIFNKNESKAYDLLKFDDIFCFRLSCRAGFSNHAYEAVNNAILNKKIAVIYAHPHSLKAENPQNIKYLIPFLEYITLLRNKGVLDITTPSALTQEYFKDIKK